MQTYKTAQVAKLIGVHPNTVRLYEDLGFIPKAQRAKNGYRIFTDFHIAQFRLARLAFSVEILQNGLRKKIIGAIKCSAQRDFDGALHLCEEYIEQLERERDNALEAAQIAHSLMQPQKSSDVLLKRTEVSKRLNVSPDSLRNWEMNGLLKIKRRENGYRVYSEADVRRIKVILALRCANYSLEAILRMLCAAEENPRADIEAALNTPREDDDIISVCDTLLHSLEGARKNALDMKYCIEDMKNKF